MAQTFGIVNAPTSSSELGGQLDQLIDPVTLDYVDTADGDWQETADSRSKVLCMIEIRLGRDYAAPRDGTMIKELLERGEPVTPTIVVAECERAMRELVDAGEIADVTVIGFDDKGRPFVDESGRAVIKLYWRDLASGSPVDLVYAPFQG